MVFISKYWSFLNLLSINIAPAIKFNDLFPFITCTGRYDAFMYFLFFPTGQLLVDIVGSSYERIIHAGTAQARWPILNGFGSASTSGSIIDICKKKSSSGTIIQMGWAGVEFLM